MPCNFNKRQIIGAGGLAVLAKKILHSPPVLAKMIGFISFISKSHVLYNFHKKTRLLVLMGSLRFQIRIGFTSYVSLAHAMQFLQK